MVNTVLKVLFSVFLMFGMTDCCVEKTPKTAYESVKEVELVKDTIKVEKPLRKAKKQGIKGIASHYGKNYGKKRKMANGEYYNPHKYTCAMTMYPMGSMVLVRNLKNGKTVEVKVTDRGPFIKGRIIDLSVKAAEELDIMHCGVAEVEVIMLC
jgi:rare lipoprotein A